jgi:tetratricopeptide (TPR) repeat protein
MSTQKYPWITRKVADEIYEKVITADNVPVIYFIQAPAGAGKTFLARDTGVRLGSSTGYEPARRGNVVWSGILDVYDPDTNSNQGIERRLIGAFSQTGLEFEAYFEARSMYDVWFKGGIVGSSLEEQRKKVETAFAEGLKRASAQQTLVLAFDTIERLESAVDHLQQMQADRDTISVMDWLIYQIKRLDKGAVLLFGRRASRFYQQLCDGLAQAQRPAPILLDLGALDVDEARQFFDDRVQRYPQLTRLLDMDLQALLLERTDGNPLLLDLALLSLVESQDPRCVRQALEHQEDLQMVTKALLGAYLNAFEKPERATVLRYLALARNGLFDELLRALEPNHADALIAELQQMGVLPFVKVRDISVAVSGQEARILRRTYFLHDAVYALCDEVWLKPKEVVRASQRVVDWYDMQIKTPKDADLIVESLFYRMRANPIVGYQWYLQQADQAIRSAHTGLDIRLRDAMRLFLISAASDYSNDPGQSLSSPIDRDNVAVLMPEIFDDFRLDSAILWMKRYMIRGKTEQAVHLGEQELAWVESLFQQRPVQYRLAFAEYLLWYGQAMMYGYEIDQALAYYQRVTDLLSVLYTDVSIEEILTNLNDFERWRLTLVLGRTYNNRGYAHWMYKGQHHLALQEFQQAVRFFRITGLDITSLEEELANSDDNMGRDHAVLGNEFQAIQLIKKGLEIRKSLELMYRVALSTNSLALALTRFGRVEQALKTIETALIHFRRTEVSRGIGLGLLTRGMIYRNMAEMHEELGISVEEALRYTNLAETDLKDAVRYFSDLVNEPIREVQARNEMACCYRARYLFLHQSGATKNEQDMALIQGRAYFRQAIELAHKRNYNIEEMDSMQDLAVLLTRAGQYDDAERYLNLIRSKIPEQYVIQSGRGLMEIPVAERVDAYYKLLGQVDLLEGAISYERGVQQARDRIMSDEKPEQPTREAWLETARHYLFAVSYFNHYATEAFVRGITFARIYKRFESCDPALVHDITQKYMPRWVEEYQLSEELFGSLLRDVFGLFAS